MKTGDLPQVPPATWAQRRTLPLFISLAKAWNHAGDPEQALQLLDARLDGGKLDAVATSQALRAKAEIIHQHRLVKRGQVFLNALRTAPTPPDPETLRLVEEIVIEATAPPRKRRTYLVDLLTYWSGWVVGLGVGALILWLTFKLLLWVFGRYSEWLAVTTSVDIVLRLGTFVLLLASVACLVVIVPRFSVRFRRWSNHLCHSATVARLRIRPTGTDAGVNARAVAISLAQLRIPREFRKRLRAFVRGCAKALPVMFLLGIRKSWPAFHETLLSESVQTEAAWLAELGERRSRLSPQSPATSDEVIAELRTMLSGSGPMTFALALAPEASIAHFAWEDGLARLLAADDGKPPENLAPFRARPPVGDEGKHKYPWRAADGESVRTLIVSHWLSLFLDAWQQGAQGAGFGQRLARVFYHGTAAAAAPTPNFRICHLVGETIRSSAGVRFRTSSSVVSKVAETAPPLDDEDRSAEQLLREETGLFIVQEIPETSGQRSQTDRERTANMRRFANELFQGGAWAVLLIPNLPSTLAVEIIKRISRAVHWRRSPSFHELIELSRNVRAEVAAASAHGTPEFLSELAWEVTLFARSRAHTSLASKQKTDALG
jgi:hypothetical protein